jgi:DNA polymerase-3 subunit epsilon
MILNFVDIETNGASHKNGKIIEIGIVKTENMEITEKYNKLINPLSPVPEFISNLTGINDKNLSDAPTFEEISHEILEKLNDGIFIAHNVDFDYMFIKSEFTNVNYNFNIPRLCSIIFTKHWKPNHTSYSLENLIDELEISVVNRHRALDDALAITKIFQSIYETSDKQDFKKSVYQKLKNY